MNIQLKYFLVFSNILLVTLTIGSYLSLYCNPSTYGFIALLGLAYPALLMANLLYIGIWVVFNPKWAMGSILILLIGINSIFNILGFKSSVLVNPAKKQLQVATFNAQFGKPLTLNKGKQRKILEKGYLQYLEQFKKLDVLCTKEHNQYTHNQVKKTIGFPYQYTSQNKYVTTYSKYPIINSGSIPNFSNNPAIHCIWVDIFFEKKDTLRIYNAHLEPNTQTGKTSNAINDSSKESPIDISMALGLLEFYPQSATKRVQQVKKIVAHNDNSPYPSIICIDLNDTPQSRVYSLLSKNQKDSFRERGNGLGATFGSTLGNRMLSLRLDYIFSDTSFDFINHTIAPSIYSDHHLILATLEW